MSLIATGETEMGCIFLQKKSCKSKFNVLSVESAANARVTVTRLEKRSVSEFGLHSLPFSCSHGTLRGYSGEDNN